MGYIHEILFLSSLHTISESSYSIKVQSISKPFIVEAKMIFKVNIMRYILVITMTFPRQQNRNLLRQYFRFSRQTFLIDHLSHTQKQSQRSLHFTGELRCLKAKNIYITFVFTSTHRNQYPSLPGCYVDQGGCYVWN